MIFDHLGIQFVQREDVEDALKLREGFRVDPFHRELYGFIFVSLFFSHKKLNLPDPLGLFGSQEEMQGRPISN